jgi:hypothetical protein
MIDRSWRGFRWSLAASLYLMSAGGIEAGERVVSPLLAGANQSFQMAGIYYGTLPAAHPESRRAEFIKVLKDSGIHAIRFPGGTMANLFLLDNDPAMREALGITFFPEADKKVFTSLWQYLDFCREAKIEPIYQLNTVLHAEGPKVYCLADTREKKVWGLPKVTLDPSKREDAAKAVTAVVRQVAERGFRIQHWEMGNEEYGYPVLDPRDYADIVTRFTRAIRRADRTAQIWVTLGDNAIRKPESDFARWAGTLLSELAKTELREDPNLGFTLHYSWPAIVDVAEPMVRKHGFKPLFAVTEFHMAGGGDYTDLSPRFGYAIALAKYLISMVPDPRIEILCIHDLTSQNFGIIHYNQKSYGPPDLRTWDPALGYQLMPAAHAYGLFGRFVGGTLVSEEPRPVDRLVVAFGEERRIFAVNEGRDDRTVRWGRSIVGAGARRFEATSLVPEAEAGVEPLRADKVTVKIRTGEIPGEELELVLPATSITYCRSYGG